jgi:hypothetical protein
MNLFLKPPVIDPRDYLSDAEAVKTASTRLTSPPGYWDDEIRQTLLREHPYVPADRVIVNFSQKDETTGTAMGYVSVSGAPTVSIPVIIKNRELSPMDVMIVRHAPSPSEMSGDQEGSQQQGAGDMTDDKVMPLNEDTFNHAMDAGTVGTPVPPHATTGTAYTEDASALRLPFRGRTVMASYVGISDAQKAALEQIVSKDASIAAGFLINKSAEVIDSWLAASAPARSLHAKIASAHVERDTAWILESVPVELATADFLAADIFVNDETSKVAAVFEAVDLTNPEAGKARWLAFEDGSYCRAPEMVAAVKLSEADEVKVASDLLNKLSTPSLRIGQTLVFSLDDVFTAPAKLASVKTSDATQYVTLKLEDTMDRSFEVILDRRIKQATYEESTGTWVFPLSARVLVLGEHAELLPAEPEKVAAALERNLTDHLICSENQYTLVIRGQTFGTPQIAETKMAAVLDNYFTNGEELLELVKVASTTDQRGVGVVRFGSDMPDLVEEIVKKADNYEELSVVLADVVRDCRMPLDKAIKLAAAIGDPQGVDAVLGAGFLTEDNLAEFVNLSDQFEETVSKLARLLLAVRMGFPGDETATVVAMKSLSRVAERLQSAGQEV